MKKLIILFLCLSLVGLTACQGEQIESLSGSNVVTDSLESEDLNGTFESENDVSSDVSSDNTNEDTSEDDLKNDTSGDSNSSSSSDEDKGEGDPNELPQIPYN